MRIFVRNDMSEIATALDVILRITLHLPSLASLLNKPIKVILSVFVYENKIIVT